MNLHFLARDLGVHDVRWLAQHLTRSQYLDWMATYEIEEEMVKKARRKAERGG